MTPPPTHHHGRRAVIALAAALPLLIGACGSAVPSASTGPSPTTPAASTPAAVAPSVRAGPGASPSPTGSGTAFDPTGLTLTFQTVVSGLVSPLAVVNAHDGSNRLFVVEQLGRILIVRDGAIVKGPFMDITDQISSGGERGLLGVAFHPKFPADPRVFVDYTDPAGDTQVSSFTVPTGTPDRVDPGSEVRIIHIKQPYPNHNGGALAFGPDGDLYIAMGDGGSGGDPQGNGQSLTTLLAKILRIDIDHPSGGTAYGIPADNPYASGGGQPEIWLTGLRNPWRMSFDRTTGDLWIGDVGQDTWEEVDVQRAGAPAGTNFGWNRMEGNHCYLPRTECRDPSLTLPVTDYGHDVGCTVIGGYVYRGTAQPALAGGYVFADYCSGRVWAIDPATSTYRPAPSAIAGTDHSFAAFGEDEAGELYAVDISGGELLRVVASRG
jgi:glucose/arabinose dehydrogenase